MEEEKTNSLGGQFLNKIHFENCLDTMSKMSGNMVDLTVTSPPY